MKLIDVRTEDGSRHFARLPEGADWDALCNHLKQLPEVSVAQLVAEWTAEPRIEFTYQDHRCTVRRQEDEYCFFVRDPRCSDVPLYRLALHCERLLAIAAVSR